MKKRFIVALLALILFAMVFRGFLWRAVSSYEDIKQLPLQALTDKTLKEKIQTETQGMNGNEVIAYCRKLTAGRLSFSMYHAENNINKMFPKSKAHCVGYAAFFASTCQYAFHVNGINGHCDHARGWIHILGMNIHAPFRDVGSLKDHDYVNVRLGDKTIIVDPSIEDFLGTY